MQGPGQRGIAQDLEHIMLQPGFGTADLDGERSVRPLAVVAIDGQHTGAVAWGNCGRLIVQVATNEAGSADRTGDPGDLATTVGKPIVDVQRPVTRFGQRVAVEV